MSTVLNNSSLVSGNLAIHANFIQIMAEGLGVEITRRVLDQYMGQSDKGSIAIIRALPIITGFLGNIGRTLATPPSGSDASPLCDWDTLKLCVKTPQAVEFVKSESVKPLPAEIGPYFATILSNPHVVYDLNDLSNEIKKEITTDYTSADKRLINLRGKIDILSLLRDASFGGTLEGAPFPVTDSAARGALAIKMAHSFTEGLGPYQLDIRLTGGPLAIKITGNEYIGSSEFDARHTAQLARCSTLQDLQNLSGVATDIKDTVARYWYGWVYSVKFAGCRLNDFFDSVTPQNFTDAATQPNKASAPALYSVANLAAAAVNKFALQLQNRVYELYGLGSIPEIPHSEIDHFYARITANEFGELFADAELTARLKKTVGVLRDNLNQLLPDGLKGLTAVPTEPSDAMAAASAIQKNALEAKLAAARIFSTDYASQGANREALARRDGLLLFFALFNLISAATVSLQGALPAPATPVVVTTPDPTPAVAATADPAPSPSKKVSKAKGSGSSSTPVSETT